MTNEKKNTDESNAQAARKMLEILPKLQPIEGKKIELMSELYDMDRVQMNLVMQQWAQLVRRRDKKRYKNGS